MFLIRLIHSAVEQGVRTNIGSAALTPARDNSSSLYHLPNPPPPPSPHLSLPTNPPLPITTPTSTNYIPQYLTNPPFVFHTFPKQYKPEHFLQQSDPFRRCGVKRSKLIYEQTNPNVAPLVSAFIATTTIIPEFMLTF